MGICTIGLFVAAFMPPLPRTLGFVGIGVTLFFSYFFIVNANMSTQAAMYLACAPCFIRCGPRPGCGEGDREETGSTPLRQRVRGSGSDGCRCGEGEWAGMGRTLLRIRLGKRVRPGGGMGYVFLPASGCAPLHGAAIDGMRLMSCTFACRQFIACCVPPIACACASCPDARVPP
eukprot:8941-Chlamydomonas_euryale.AAC.1